MHLVIPVWRHGSWHIQLDRGLCAGRSSEAGNNKSFFSSLLPFFCALAIRLNIGQLPQIPPIGAIVPNLHLSLSLLANDTYETWATFRYIPEVIYNSNSPSFFKKIMDWIGYCRYNHVLSFLLKIILKTCDIWYFSFH